jgi:hypothetical protein
MKKEDLELIGVTLYKCEGTKLRKDKRYPNTYVYSIEFTNSDPILLNLYLKFLIEIIKIDKERIKIELFVYEDHNKDKLKKFWSDYLKIDLINFQKIIVQKTKGSKYRPNPLGTCKIRCSGKNDYLRLDEIIKKRLGKNASLINYKKWRDRIVV